MKPKLGIIAPQLMKNHFSYYEALVILFSNLNYEITFFGCSWFKEQLSAKFPLLKFYVRPENTSAFSFFRSIRAKVKQCDFIIIEQSYGVTLSYIFGISRVKVKKLYTIHNVNSWLSPTFSFMPKATLTNWAHRYIISNVDGIIVVSANLKKEINKKKLMAKGAVFYLPFRYPELNNTSDKTKNDCHLIVVPGTINPLRRDYHVVLEALENILRLGIHNIKVVFLGKPIFEIKETSQVIDSINKINRCYKNAILFWEDFIPQAEFDYYLNNASFFVSNLKEFYPYGKNREIYGVTKETGIPVLMYQYKKPCIIIGSYAPPKQLVKHTIKTSNTIQLESLFKKISTGEVKQESFAKGYNKTLVEMRGEINEEIRSLLRFVN